MPPDALSFAADPDAGWLYDCHARRFAAVELGANMATGFTPLFLSQLFGLSTRDWAGAMADTADRLSSASPPERAKLLAERRPKRSLTAARDMALLAYPSAARFLDLIDEGPGAPFRLREEVLLQPNVPLRALRRVDASGAASVVADAEQLADAGGRRALAAASRVAPRSAAPPPPGVYLTGHSGLLVRGERGGVLFDPISLGRIGHRERPIDVARLAACTDVVAVSHGHFDHYHLPTLLALGRAAGSSEGAALWVPEVPRASVVCEDLGARLGSFGLDVSAPEEGGVFEVGDLVVHVLPFVGEQFLTSETYPEARSWGRTFVLETPVGRVLNLVDSGFEPERSVFDVVQAWVARHGPIDLVVGQAIGMRVGLGQGDPDLQIAALACAARAPEAFELLCPERRVTLAPEDVPRLCEIAGARAFLPYGQFQLSEGERCVAPSVVARLRAELARAEQRHVQVLDLVVGEGVEPARPERRARLSPP